MGVPCLGTDAVVPNTDFLSQLIQQLGGAEVSTVKLGCTMGACSCFLREFNDLYTVLSF